MSVSGPYAMVPNPGPPSSSVTGPRTSLVQVPAYNTMASPVAAAAIPAGAQLFRDSFIAEILGNVLGQGITSLGAGATGALTPATTGGGSNSRFMITLGDVRDIQQYVDNENFKRRMLGMELLNAEDIIREREAALRESAAQAGERELARKLVDAGAGVTQEALRTAGTQAQATSGLGQQLAQAYLTRPNIDPAIAAVATGR